MARPLLGIYEILPKCDDYGNYYFRRTKEDVEPVAILTRMGNSKSEKGKCYMLSLGPNGTVWDGTVIREFPNPILALEYLQDLVIAGTVPVYPPAKERKK